MDNRAPIDRMLESFRAGMDSWQHDVIAGTAVTKVDAALADVNFIAGALALATAIDVELKGKDTGNLVNAMLTLGQHFQHVLFRTQQEQQEQMKGTDDER